MAQNKKEGKVAKWLRILIFSTLNRSSSHCCEFKPSSGHMWDYKNLTWVLSVDRKFHPKGHCLASRGFAEWCKTVIPRDGILTLKLNIFCREKISLSWTPISLPKIADLPIWAQEKITCMGVFLGHLPFSLHLMTDSAQNKTQIKIKIKAGNEWLYCTCFLTWCG